MKTSLSPLHLHQSHLEQHPSCCLAWLLLVYVPQQRDRFLGRAKGNLPACPAIALRCPLQTGWGCPEQGRSHPGCPPVGPLMSQELVHCAG